MRTFPSLSNRYGTVFNLYSSTEVLILKGVSAFIPVPEGRGFQPNKSDDRCFHLSIGFFDLNIQRPRPFEKKEAEMWVKLFYPKWQRYIWHESSVVEKSDRQPEVEHYRVLCDVDWQPIIPRGEVYSRELTEAGWESFTEQGGIKPR